MSEAGEAESTDRAREEGGGGVLRLVMLVVGSLLFLASVVGTTSLEGMNGEFGYFPFTPEPLPFAAMRGFTAEQLVAHALRLFLGAPGLVLVWLSTRGTPATAPTEAQLGRAALWVSTASVVLVALAVFFLFGGRAIVDDELTYRVQAQSLREGRIGLQGLPYFMEVFSIKTPLGYTGKYLFGEPLVQVLGLVVGYPALLHIPFAAATLFLFHRTVRLLSDASTAAIAVMLLACSPMFIATTATAQSQATSLLCVVMAAFGYVVATRGRPLLGAALVGVGIGFGVAVRIQVAVPVGLVLVPLTAFALFKERRFGAVGVLALTLLGFAGLIGGYNYLLSGNPLKLPWFLTGAPERYGFGQVWRGDTFRHTPLGALENLLVVAIRFNAWWLGWPASLLLLGIWFKLGRPLRGARPFLLVGLAVLLFEVGYYSTGISDTGPIYHYELLLPGALLGANAIREAFARNPSSMRALLIAQFGLGWTSFAYEQGSRLDRLVHHIHDGVEKALAEVPPGSVLFYEPRCAESTARGWIHEAFPVRYRDEERDPVLTFPRPPAGYMRGFLARFPERACWYFHIDPESQEPRVMPCRDALPRFNRPRAKLGEQCIWNAPTATRLGLFDPWPHIEARTLRPVKLPEWEGTFTLTPGGAPQ